jgi:hypothetical protein
MDLDHFAKCRFHDLGKLRVAARSVLEEWTLIKKKGIRPSKLSHHTLIVTLSITVNKVYSELEKSDQNVVWDQKFLQNKKKWMNGPPERQEV